MLEILATRLEPHPPVSRQRGKPAPPCRRFGLLDAMILIAATAIGLALTRPPFMEALIWRWSLTDAGLRFAVAAPLLAAWTLAVLALRWRVPRPVRARLFRQPGVVAAVAATAILGIKAVLMACVWIDPGWPPVLRPNASFFLQGWWCNAMSGLPMVVGVSVAGAWIVLWVSGRRRPEPGWIDRLGRLIGGAWIASSLILFWGGMNWQRHELAQSIDREKQVPRSRTLNRFGPGGIPVHPSQVVPPAPNAPPPL